MDDPANPNPGAYQDPNSGNGANDGQAPQFQPPQPSQSSQPYPPQPQYGQPAPAASAPQPAGGAPVAPQADGQTQRPPLRIDDALLTELGLGALPEDERKALQKHIYETLEMNVGMRLADQMSNEQLDEFEQYFNARDDAGAFRWLETNFPNYKDIVAEEFEKLKAEVAQNASQIVAASQQQASMPPTSQTQPLSAPDAVQSPQEPPLYDAGNAAPNPPVPPNQQL